MVLHQARQQRLREHRLGIATSTEEAADAPDVLAVIAAVVA